MKNNKPVFISPWTHGSYYIFSVIENGLKTAINSELKEIEINFLSFGFLKAIIANIYFNFFRYFNKFSSNKIRSKSIFKDIRSGSIANLRYMDINLKVLRTYPTLKEICQAMFCTLNILFKNKKYLRCFFLRREALYRKMIEFKYNSVEIGILSASYTLRFEPNAGGDLKKSKFFLLNFINSIYLLNLSNFIFDRIKPKFVQNNEQLYLADILRRNLHVRGCTAVDIDRYSGNKNNKLQLCEPNQKIYVNTVLQKGYKNLTKKETLEIDKKLKSRVEQNSTIWYQMGIGNVKKIENDFLERIKKSSENKLNVVIFLHSVEDAQYEFGFDGFLDIVEWTYSTIDWLIGNDNISNILVKPHTSINYKKNNCEKLFLKRLRKKYIQNKKVEFINQRIMNKEFKKLKNLFGISHHGSVIEELSYMDIPCICSYCTPWKNYPFLKMWSTTNQYFSILNDLSIKNFNQYKSNKKLLFKYSYHYRKLDPKNGFWGRLYNKYYGYDQEIFNAHTVKVFSKITDNITYDDKHLKDLFEN
ncbi:hypothetical protein OA610_00985 [Prochlorococcus sp. AH-716-F13]|nr:hypothetical protein [Prochlorococcus sp. AH-716-F13]